MRERTRYSPPIALLVLLGSFAVGCKQQERVRAQRGNGRPTLSTRLEVVQKRPGRSSLMAGAASVDVTPDPGVPLAGYGNPPRRRIDHLALGANILALAGSCIDPDPRDAATLFVPAVGSHDPLTARALVLANGETKAAIVKVDLIGISRRLRDDIERVAASLGIPGQNLVISATHTHSGPGAITEKTVWEVFATDCFHEPTYVKLRSGVARALVQAHATLRIARFGAGFAPQRGVSVNRTGRPGVIDPGLGLIKIVQPDGRPIAALINFAVHGVCLPEENLLFSGDLMGFAERALEERIGGGVAIFTNGAEGDVNPRHLGYSGARRIGALLAETAGKLWSATPTRPRIEIQGAMERVAMPDLELTGNLRLLDLYGALCVLLPDDLCLPVDTWFPWELPFAALRLDDVVLAALPGEAIAEIGLAVKAAGAKLGFRHTFVIGLANDHMGYVTTRAQYERGRYESQLTFYGPATGQVVVSSLVRQMQAVRSPPRR